jgi:hypothetical protein
VPDDPRYDELQRQLDTLAPPDVVRGELTRETLDRLDAMAGREVEITYAGEVVENVDGVPTAVAPSETVTAEVVGLTISRAETDRLGVSENTHPSLHVVDHKERP